jgi:ceramide glucosyltransferase
MPGLGSALFGVALLNRILESWIVGWGVVRDPVALKRIWMFPLRDLLGFIVWVASYTGATTAWRDSRYELRGDKIVLRENAEV